ncbi:Hydrolase [Frankia canadensis]|uniref:Hydrolase n=1 Tax=Frankia canadensis TaxID=1836972 RepID=A0A2I2L141_9ACTN|nr:amidohydrolase family protein [Frankia canadensis]SNQ51628.1 Hydrolase [Frankia canadensis]SOU58918.1 Hydrolase [Frankia canadensis]
MSTPNDSGRFTFIDAHVHLWDLANGWYPFFEPTERTDDVDQTLDVDELGMGDMSALRRSYLTDDYLGDTARYDIPSVVHVHATTVPTANLDETRWLAKLAAERGLIRRLVAQVDGSAGADGIRRELEQHAAESDLFIGARLVEGIDYDSDAGRAFVGTLDEHGWVYDAVAHAGGGIRELAGVAARHEGLTIMLEHAGWPLTREGTFETWRTELAELAARPNVWLKLSGFAMWLHRIEASDLRPWLETCVETFGPQRCVVGSNFPIDSLWTDFDALLGTYRTITEQYGAEVQRGLFETNVQRVYRF